MPVPVSWRRLALRTLRRLGLDAGRAGPGTVVLARGERVAVQRLAPGVALVGDRAAVQREWLAAERGIAAILMREHVAAVLRQYRVNCVLDVGANRGQYARMLRDAGYDGHIVSFEPVGETFERLRGAAAGDPRWSVHRCALGREDGILSMRVVPGTMSSALAPTRFGAGRYAQLREPETEEVPVRRLDGILAEVLAGVPDPRPYLKLDTQGFDLEAFAGLGDRVREVVAMQSEVSLMPIYEGMPAMPEALAVYEAAGFEVSALFTVSRQRRTARAIELDCVMVRAAAL